MRTTKLILTTGPNVAMPHGDVIVLDWEQKHVIDSYRFTHRVYKHSHKGLAGASWHEQTLLVATECELLEFAVNPLQLKAARSFPFLNDVHFLAAQNGRVWVVNTGLDCVEEFDAQWRLLQTHDLIHLPARRFRYALQSLHATIAKWYESIRGWRPPHNHLDRRVLFRNTRKLLIKHAYRRKDHDWRHYFFRPHVLHPNHMMLFDNDVWITLCNTGEIVSLKTGKILATGLGRPHDGIVVGDEHYLTDCTSNRIIIHEFDPGGPSLGKFKAEKTVTKSTSEGYLRGVAVVGDRIFTGLTVRRGKVEHYPRARVIALDRKTLEPLDEWDVPDEYGTILFSILDATNVYD